MKRTSLALMAGVLAGWASLMPAQAVPPTVTPSPGYDAAAGTKGGAANACRADRQAGCKASRQENQHALMRHSLT
jgi:hypothetical protein